MQQVRTFSGFRKVLSRIVADQHPDFANELGDLQVEDMIAKALYGDWRDIEAEVRDAQEHEGWDEPRAWGEILSDAGHYARNAIVNAANEYNNTWNYGHGSAPDKIVDINTLGDYVEDAWDEMFRYIPGKNESMLRECIRGMIMEAKKKKKIDEDEDEETLPNQYEFSAVSGIAGYTGPVGTRPQKPGGKKRKKEPIWQKQADSFARAKEVK